jgi:OOP family OmpA-OmpF porin
MYWKGVNNRIDWSLRYNGVFTDYSKIPGVGGSDYASEFELSLHGRPLTDNHLFQPFYYSGHWGWLLWRKVGSLCSIGWWTSI